MKKLFSLLLLAMLTMSAWAATTVNFDLTTGYENADVITTIEKDGITLTFDKGSNNNEPKWFTTGTAVRLYGGSTLNIASDGDNITEVVFTFSGTGYTMNNNGAASVDAGTYTESGTTGTWTGDAQSFTITRGGTSGHARIQTIAVTMGGEVVTIVAAPEFTPANGATFTDTQVISLSCATAGATISYSTNNLTWNTYSEPFTISETTTVYAKATLNGVDSEVVSATFNKVETPSGNVVTFKSSTDQGNGSTERGEWTVEKDGVTMTCSDGTVYTDNYRIYQGATLTFTSTVGNITMIEFDGGDNSRPISNLSTQTGTLSPNGSNGTWMGDAAEIVFTASAQARATEIRVYIEGEAPVVVAVPTFSPAGQEFVESIDVTLSAEEGATIYFNFDNGETWTEYTQAFHLTETTTIYAKAVKDGVESEVVHATYTLKPAATEVESLEITADMAAGVEFTFTGNAGVTAQKGGYLWLRDDTGYGLIFGNTNDGANPVFTPGTILKSGWTAKTKDYNGLMEFENATGLDSIGFNAEYAVPQTITALDDDDMLNAYVKVENVKSFTKGSGKNVTATLADGTMAMYNTFNETVPTTEGDYTVTGAVSTYNGNMQLTIISIEGNFVVAPTLPASCDFEESMTVEITCNDADATIMYSTDGTTWNVYTEALTITETTTVQAKAVKGNVESEVVSATYTKIDPATMVTYTLVTDVNELADGDKIILVGFCNTEGDDFGKAYAMAGYRGDHYSNFATVEVTVEDNTVTTGLANVITLEANGDFWNFKAEEGYLYAAGNETKNKKNHMRVEDEPDETGNANAVIYMDTDSMSIIFQGDNTRNHLRFNYNSGSPLFSCYAQGSPVQTPAYIFKAQTQEPPVEVKRGDVNKDGDVTISDVTALIDALLSGSLDEADDFSPANADANLDESISIGDVTAIIDYLLSHVWPE